MQKQFQELYKKQNKIYVTTTGISQMEKAFIKKNLSSNYILEDVMTTATAFLFVYKCSFTDKYIQALQWKIPIVHISYLYNIEESITKYIMLPFEGSTFSTSNISNDMFINFYILQGSKYKPDVGYCTSFLIADSESEKQEYAANYKIPIINCNSGFNNEFNMFKRDHDIISLEENDFSNLTFYLDKNLPQHLFNCLKRLIIENNGIRMPIIDREIDFIITFPINYDTIIEKIDKKDIDYFETKILHYQYIFDSVESKKRIKHEFYSIFKVQRKEILKNVVCYIDQSLQATKQTVVNKIIALGGIVKQNINSGITHLIIKNKREYVEKSKKKIPYKIVVNEWIEQCLYNLKYMNEEKYTYKKLALDLFKTKSAPLFIKNKVSYKGDEEEKEKEFIFQFTGLTTHIKAKAIEILNKYNIKYIDSDKFEGCTHLIMGFFCTSEKFMCSVAKGNWILIPDFINDYDGCKNFDFEKYEWKVDENTDEKHIKIIKSIQRWRTKIKLTNNGAFKGWTAKFICEDDKKPSLETLIKSGGGNVTEEEEYTHLFVTKKYNNEFKGVKTYSINYLYSYLFRSEK